MDQSERKIEELNETEVRSQFITPAILAAGWDLKTHVREEFKIAAGRIDVRGQRAVRQRDKKADYVLFLKPNIPLAVVEAKDATHSVGAGMQQALGYAVRLNAPFVFSSNGKGFVFHDRTGHSSPMEREITLDEFPGPIELQSRFEKWLDLEDEMLEVAEQDYRIDPGKDLRAYQINAINSAVTAVARGQRRVLLVMATGTGKTLTAFHIAWRLWKSKQCKRILFLADRNVLIDQARRNDFKPFGNHMVQMKGHQADPSYEIYLSLYQAISGTEEERNVYKEFSRDFFDLVVIDECHRGSAADDAAWREILDYFDSAIHLGMTATPKETKEISNITYFGEPVFTYSLKQGIEDGYLAPYKVVRVDIDKDLQGWRPESGKTDKHGEEIPDREYGQSDFDRELVLEQRTKLVAEKVTEFLKGTDRFAKTIVFCKNQDHAERMRKELVNLNADLVKEHPRYVMRITADDQEGKKYLDDFIDPEAKTPVIATTSELLSTGVDAQTCKLIVLDQRVASMTKFKQIIGRGTRVREDYDKLFFTILDFRKATQLFADPDFDGDPVVVYVPKPDDPVVPPVDPDPTGGSDGGHDDGETPPPIEPPPPPGPHKKYYVDDVPVYVMSSRVQYLGPDGKLITESLEDYTRKQVRGEFETLDDFIKYWREAERKHVIVEELAQRGVLFEALADDVGQDYAAFDLICHVVFDQPPLTRKQRAANVRGSDYFATYSDTARKVLDALLDKYADDGVEPDADTSVLRVTPFPLIGTPIEIVNEFGGRDAYDTAIRALEEQLYAAA